MNKFIVLLLFAVLAAPVFAGGAPEESMDDTMSDEIMMDDETMDGEMMMANGVIGITKIVAHPALDAVEQGIIDELTERGYDGIEYDLQNANGDLNTTASIAAKYQQDNVLLAVGIATPSAQALVNKMTAIPVIYAAVTDPVSAGLVDSNDRGGKNVTGTSDATPVFEQLSLLNDLIRPRTIGNIYSSGEANSVAIAEQIRAAASRLGIEIIESSVTNSAEVRQATLTIVNQVDAIYVSTDNTVVSALPALVEAAYEAGLPVMSADPSSAENLDILIAWGFDYYKMGRATGDIIDRVLTGTPTSDIPTVYMTDPSEIDLWINLDVANTLAIDIPEDLIAKATTLIENGVAR